MTEPSNLPADDMVTTRLSGVQLAIRIHRIRFMARRYWWVVLCTILLALGIQLYRCTQLAARYVSSARMMVNGHVSLPQGGDMFNEELSNFYGTQVALMKSSDIYLQAVSRVRAIHPEVQVDEGAIADAYQEPKTSIFKLLVTSTNPEFAKYLLDSIMDAYLASKRGRKDQATQETISTIAEGISRADSDIQNDDKQLLEFEKENNVVFIEEQSNNAATYLVGLNNDLARAVKEHDLLSLENESQIPHADNSQDSAGKPTATKASSDMAANITAAQENIEKLRILQDDYSKVLKEKHPKMIALSAEISKEEKFLDLLKTRNIADQDAYRQDLELQIKILRQQIDDWNKKSLDLSARLGNYQQLKAKRNRDQVLYDQLISQIQSVNLNKSLDQDMVVVMEPASVAAAVNPEYPKQMAYGLVAGLLAGIGIIYFIHRLDDRIDSSFDLEENIDYPLVGQVPLAVKDRRSKRVPLLSEQDKRHVLVESHRNIRSSILFRASDLSKPRSLMVCSAIPGEGKSTLTSNLAITFALAGTRTLLIDGDMRRGVLHTLFNMPSSPGLSEFLQQEVSWPEVVRKTNVPNLDVIPRGKAPQHPGDLLLSPPVDIIIHETLAEYEMVLWDSVPLLATDDAANLCSKLESIIFVARIGHSSIHSIRSALEILSHRNANIFGVVVNAVEPNQPGYYDRYRYKQYYTSADT